MRRRRVRRRCRACANSAAGIRGLHAAAVQHLHALGARPPQPLPQERMHFLRLRRRRRASRADRPDRLVRQHHQRQVARPTLPPPRRIAGRPRPASARRRARRAFRPRTRSASTRRPAPPRPSPRPSRPFRRAAGAAPNGPPARNGIRIPPACRRTLRRYTPRPRARSHPARPTRSASPCNASRACPRYGNGTHTRHRAGPARGFQPASNATSSAAFAASPPFIFQLPTTSLPRIATVFSGIARRPAQFRAGCMPH